MALNFVDPLLITFFGYVVVVFIISFVATRLTANVSDYVLAGRRLSGPVTALGAGASDMSSWLLMALPGSVYVFGLSMIWLPVSLIIGAYLNWSFVAKRIRIYTEIAGDALTIPEFLVNRFRDKGMALKLVTAWAIIIFFTYYSAAGFQSAAVLLQNMFEGINYHVALLIGAGVIITYTAIGGFLAVSWVDFFQGSLMFIALLMVPWMACKYVGGFDVALSAVGQHSQQHLDIWRNVKPLGLLSLLAWGFGYFGQLHINMRFMAIRSVRELPVARRICMLWMSLALFGAVLTGLFGYILYIDMPLAQPDTVFIELAQRLFNPWLAGILLSAVTSAIMSTVSAQILMSASIIVEDFLHARNRRKILGLPSLLISRIVLLLMSLIAVGIAAVPNQSIFKAVGFAWSGLGASFGPVLLFSLFWRQMTKSGAVWGIIAGGATVLTWGLVTHPIFGVWQHPDILAGFEMLPGIFVSAVVVVTVSLASRVKPSVEVAAEFDRVVAEVRATCC